MARFGFAIVRGRSMEPTLSDGDRLVVRYRRPQPAGPASRSPRPGQVAVVRLPGRDGLTVKRLARHDGECWWVERDNPAEGVDSWLAGAVADQDVVAVALARVWPRPRRL